MEVAQQLVHLPVAHVSYVLGVAIKFAMKLRH